MATLATHTSTVSDCPEVVTRSRGRVSVDIDPTPSGGHCQIHGGDALFAVCSGWGTQFQLLNRVPLWHICATNYDTDVYACPQASL